MKRQYFQKFIERIYPGTKDDTIMQRIRIDLMTNGAHVGCVYYTNQKLQILKKKLGQPFPTKPSLA